MRLYLHYKIYVAGAVLTAGAPLPDASASVCRAVDEAFVMTAAADAAVGGPRRGSGELRLPHPSEHVQHLGRAAARIRTVLPRHCWAESGPGQALVQVSG